MSTHVTATAAPGGRADVPAQDIPGVTRPISYEEYMAEPEEMARYDILDGIKHYRLYGPEGDRLPNPTLQHQGIVFNIAEQFRNFQRQQKSGRAFLAPCDVLITRDPLRTRQPDVLYISAERFGERALTSADPLSPAPELVVEIVSPSDRPSVLAAKVADYRSVDVKEVWVVRAKEGTVEITALSPEEIAVVATHRAGEIVTSPTFPALSVAVDDIFAD